MHSFTLKMLVLLACVIVVCIDNVGSALINYGRKCNNDEIDYGFRKNLWQHKAIHMCFPTPILNNNCTTIGKIFHTQVQTDTLESRNQES